MTPATLQQFLADHHMTRARFGAELGISQPRIRRMIAGSAPIPRCIQLAMAAIVNELQPWQGTDATH